MILFERGSENDILTSIDLKEGIYTALSKLGNRKKVLIIPPDFTRFHSRAGELTRYVYDFYKDQISDILPALGTHSPMTSKQIEEMFPGVPQSLFRVHNWRTDVKTCGIVPDEMVYQLSEQKVNFSWPAQANKLVLDEQHDLIISIGQVVPHEVIGMANYNKNIFVGTGGAECINKSHFIGAVYGMERIMGRAQNPVRQLLNYASEHFIQHLPIIYVHTVVGKDETGKLVVRGLFIGSDYEVFEKAAKLSLNVNFEICPKPLKKVIVFLDPSEFKSTWLGNKAIYRTRMAIADGGELIILAPGLKEFGEDKEIDQLIRKYGYRGTNYVLHALSQNSDLQNNLSAAAHLIHGSSEGRFSITYCPGYLTDQEISSVGFKFANLNQMLKKYKPDELQDGYNIINGEEIFYISNPALGLWSTAERFSN